MYWVCMFVKAILRLAKIFVKEDRYMRSAKKMLSLKLIRSTLPNADLKLESCKSQLKNPNLLQKNSMNHKLI